MTAAGWIEIAVFLAVLTALTAPMGAYLARVYRGDVNFLGWVERPLLRMLGDRATRGQDWKAYAKSILIFSALFWLLLYLILRTQSLHPWNPLGLTSTTWDNAFNTAGIAAPGPGANSPRG